MKPGMSKGNYDELLNSMEREYYNSELNKLADRKAALTQPVTSD
jgi:hypothetical protein